MRKGSGFFEVQDDNLPALCFKEAMMFISAMGCTRCSPTERCDRCLDALHKLSQTIERVAREHTQEECDKAVRSYADFLFVDNKGD